MGRVSCNGCTLPAMRDHKDEGVPQGGASGRLVRVGIWRWKMAQTRDEGGGDRSDKWGGKQTNAMSSGKASCQDVSATTAVVLLGRIPPCGETHVLMAWGALVAPGSPALIVLATHVAPIVLTLIAFGAMIALDVLTLIAFGALIALDALVAPARIALGSPTDPVVLVAQVVLVELVALALVVVA